ncbi:MFS general substrate transporter [Xylaria bambusicola]|uniref:MFS general substrate transporter n=1 Tax=Xylaria bambusicola TaxID=326684 RepID=UPI0020081E3D|nr:MFS general substrate transporter [Xylaria bambusicola]KAI0528005.1 MFS general substrate transporter [Xylaria bambusicola]
MSQTSVELELIRSQVGSPEQGTTDNLDGNAEFSLPPVDGGKEAWLFLAASFVVDALIWGFTFSFGVFQDYYSQHEPFTSSSKIAVIGTTSAGLLYLLSPIALGIYRLFPRYVRYATPFGLLIVLLSLTLASLATSTTTLIALQGVLYAVGGTIAYTPTILFIEEWFAARKGMAYGMVWSGEGLASAVIPLILQRLLTQYGHQTTLRASGVAIFIVCAPLSFFIKPRLPPSNTVATRPWELKLLFSGIFAPYQLGNLVQGTGHFIPSIYLPTYARTVLGASGFLAALTVLLVNIATTIGALVMGVLTDRLPATTCILISSAGATLGVFLAWGLSSSLAVLYVFCIMYGLFAGSFTATWPGIMRALGHTRESGEITGIDPTLVFSGLCAGRGIGSLVSGPLSEALITDMDWKGHARAGYGSGYGTLIVYTGITALVSSSSFMWKMLMTARTSLRQ